MTRYGIAQRISRGQKKWGPALLPAPTAPSEGSAGVRNLVDRAFRPTYPLSILAHQLRRRFRSDRPPCEEPGRSTRLRGPKARWSFGPSGLLEPQSEDLASRENRPMFRGPSWEIHYRVPLRSPRFRRTPGAASRDRKIPLPAPLPGWPRQEPESSSHCLPAEIGPLVTCRFRPAVAGCLVEAGTAVPIT